MAYEALSHSAYTVYCRIARHSSFSRMMVQNFIVMTRWPSRTKTLGVFLRIYISTPWGGVSFWIIYRMVITWRNVPQSRTEYLAFLLKAIFRLLAPIGKSPMTEVNGGMYVLLNFSTLPINHNSSRSYHRQVLSLIFRSKNLYVPHNNSMLPPPHYIVAQVLKKPSTRSVVLPSTSFWDQAHILAMKSQDQLSEAYAKFTARDLEAGKKKAVEGLNLLLQRYASLPS